MTQTPAAHRVLLGLATLCILVGGCAPRAAEEATSPAVEEGSPDAPDASVSSQSPRRAASQGTTSARAASAGAASAGAASAPAALMGDMLGAAAQTAQQSAWTLQELPRRADGSIDVPASLRFVGERRARASEAGKEAMRARIKERAKAGDTAGQSMLQALDRPDSPALVTYERCAAAMTDCTSIHRQQSGATSGDADLAPCIDEVPACPGHYVTEASPVCCPKACVGRMQRERAAGARPAEVMVKALTAEECSQRSKM